MVFGFVTLGRAVGRAHARYLPQALYNQAHSIGRSVQSVPFLITLPQIGSTAYNWAATVELNLVLQYVTYNLVLAICAKNAESGKLKVAHVPSCVIFDMRPAGSADGRACLCLAESTPDGRQGVRACDLRWGLTRHRARRTL